VNHVAHGVLIRSDQSAITDTGVPEAEARIMVARRTRIEFPRPRRTICVSRCPS
jgi:hypothetical protein